MIKLKHLTSLMAFMAIFAICPSFAGEKLQVPVDISSKTQKNNKNLFPFEKEAMKNPNICPVCGKSWDMVDGKNIHSKCLEKLLPPKLEIRCGSCGQLLQTRQKNNVRYRSDIMDRDLCAHPPGSQQPVSDLVICPKCGYSGTIENHKQRITPEQKSWVLNNLTPMIQREILGLLHLDVSKLNLTRENAYKVFIDPLALNNTSAIGGDMIIETQVPEFLRTKNALLFAEKFYPEDYVLIARYSWLTAWAYRRIVCEQMTESSMLGSVKNILASLQKKFPVAPTPENRVNEMVVMYKDNTLYPLLDRQVMLIMMSGDYLRLGFRSWANDCLKSVLETVKSDSSWADLIGVVGKENVAFQRSALSKNTERRLYAIKMEGEFLKNAAENLRKALIMQLKGKAFFSIDEIPSNVYLVGEFERRLQNYGRAYAWLSAAVEMRLPEQKAGIEIWAGEQMTSIESSTGTKPVNPMAKMDDGILKALSGIVYSYNQKAVE